MSTELEVKPEGLDIKSTVIMCDKCLVPQRMELVDTTGIWYCKAGHKKALYDLIEVPKPTAPKIEPTKAEKRQRKIQLKCPFCNKVAVMEDESKVFGKLRRKYSCGHTEFLDLLAPPVDRDEIWNKLYPFQQEGVKFIEGANYQAQLGDEMGLGKTIQAQAVLRYNYEELTPCLMIVESSKVYDWKDEFKLWVGDKYNSVPDEPIIHKAGSYGMVPAFKNHIISMSLINKPRVLKSILEYGFKFMIVDESHSFKNEDADRTNALQKIAQVIPHKLFLSGTPIMNRVMEYFVPLNILRPSHFPSKQFLADRCERHESGRILGLQDWYRPKFFHQISEYVIRRTKKDAGIILPDVRIEKHFINISQDKVFVKGYNELIDELEKVMSSKNTEQQMILGIFAKMRHLVGLQKIKPIIQHVQEFLENTDEENKITIGVHHKYVGEFLMKGLSEYNPITISDEDPVTKMKRIELFKQPERRVLIASILGAGQGLNLQFCKNAIIAEREWNPAKEEQFAGRFHRIVKNADGSIKTEFVPGVDSVMIDYLNANRTIDQFMDALIELKKQVVGSTLDQDFSYDPDFIMQLAEKIVESRLYVES